MTPKKNCFVCTGSLRLTSVGPWVHQETVCFCSGQGEVVLTSLERSVSFVCFLLIFIAMFFSWWKDLGQHFSGCGGSLTSQAGFRRRCPGGTNGSLTSRLTFLAAHHSAFLKGQEAFRSLCAASCGIPPIMVWRPGCSSKYYGKQSCGSSEWMWEGWACGRENSRIRSGSGVLWLLRGVVRIRGSPGTTAPLSLLPKTISCPLKTSKL